MEYIETFAHTMMLTVKDVLPVAVLLVFFQVAILRRPVPNWKRVVVGFVFVLLGLTLFLDGLATALFPVGKIMARQLSAPEFVFGQASAPPDAGWKAYGWIYVFGAFVGFAATIAEPALIAVAYKASQVSRGSLNQRSLRLAVAFGVAVGIAVGTFRIVTGTPLYAYIIAVYVVIVIQTAFVPREIIPLAYDSGGVTTSTVTVPLLAALGLGLSETVPGSDPGLDGFGLIAFACSFPIMSVMGYAQFARFVARRSLKTEKED